jgi:Transposase
MPASTLRAIPGCGRTRPPRSHPACHCREGRNRAGHSGSLAESTGVPGAPSAERPAARSGPFSSGSGRWLTNRLLTRTHYSAGRIAALLVKPPPTLSWAQKQHLEAFLRFCPQAQTLRRMVLQFRALLRWRKATKLSAWMQTAIASPFPFLVQFAKALRRDIAAVELSIATPWNNGPLEGQINRLKVIKRQMYGRAGFELLKARVLPWEVSSPASLCTESAEDPLLV